MLTAPCVQAVAFRRIREWESPTLWSSEAIWTRFQQAVRVALGSPESDTLVCTRLPQGVGDGADCVLQPTSAAQRADVTQQRLPIFPLLYTDVDPPLNSGYRSAGEPTTTTTTAPPAPRSATDDADVGAALGVGAAVAIVLVVGLVVAGRRSNVLDDPPAAKIDRHVRPNKLVGLVMGTSVGREGRLWRASEQLLRQKLWIRRGPVPCDDATASHALEAVTGRFFVSQSGRDFPDDHGTLWVVDRAGTVAGHAVKLLPGTVPPRVTLQSGAVGLDPKGYASLRRLVVALANPSAEEAVQNVGKLRAYVAFEPSVVDENSEGDLRTRLAEVVTLPYVHDVLHLMAGEEPEPDAPEEEPAAAATVPAPSGEPAPLPAAAPASVLSHSPSPGKCGRCIHDLELGVVRGGRLFPHSAAGATA